MIISIVFIIMGLYCVFYGFKILFTGKLSKNEEAKLAQYSEKGARTYKLINVLVSVVVGLCLAVRSVIKILETQKIIGDSLIIQIVIWCIVAVMIIIYFIVAAKCKKMTD